MNWKAVSFLVGVLMAGSILGDTTPPAGPTNLASPSHGSAIGAWNDPQSKNDAVEVTWTPATDSESGLDGYSVLWSEKADDEPAAVKTIEEGVSSAKKEGLASGNNYYFHIRPVDNDGNWGATVRLGPFFIDKDLPASPASLATTSHANAVGQWLNPQTRPWPSHGRCLLTFIQALMVIHGPGTTWRPAFQTKPKMSKKAC